MRQIAHNLPAAGVPERDGVERGAGAERRDEGIDEGDLDQEAVDQSDDGAEGQHDDAPRSARAGRTWFAG